MGNAFYTIHFSPLVPVSILIVFLCLVLAFTIFSYLKARHLIGWRMLVAAAFLLFLSNPSLLEEKRNPISDVAAIVVDQSPSQSFGNRHQVTEKALEDLQASLKAIDSLDTRVIYAPNVSNALDERTDIFDAIRNGLADIPETRRAGVIVLSDGQIHDVPKNADNLSAFGPIHTLLTGDKNERDRQIKITKAPAYGLVNETIEVGFVVLDTPNIQQETVPVTVHWSGDQKQTLTVKPGEEKVIPLTIENAGQNVYEISVETVTDEITKANNKVAVVVNGVRDRLKVLLVSGQPHNGGRTWRDMLSADPGVDLVHFTILREPDKLDMTPQNELSLIAFPFRELFEIKLYDFDLIIFDRYQLNRILPTYYFGNIARFVYEGGALLEASGPSFSNEFSIYHTELEDILPGTPSGTVHEEPFKPQITELGLKHPVTMDFKQMQENWGQWLRQIDITPKQGDVVMSGHNKSPLLVLSRVGKGRVAQLASDQIWLWSRGYDGGGPQRDLLRRISHWLMKEPELDESALNSIIDGDRILLRRRSLKEDSLPVNVMKPDGSLSNILLTREGSEGWLSAEITADQTGVYTVSDSEKDHFIVAGTLNTPELSGVITTDEIMAPVAKMTGGNVRWLSDTGTPAVRIFEENRKMSGLGWIGLRKNNDYTVTGVNERAIFTPWLALILLAGLSVWMWWREGRLR